MFWDAIGRQIVVTASISLVLALAVGPLLNFLSATNAYASGTAYFLGSMVASALSFNRLRSTIFSFGAAGLIFGIAGAAAVNWALGLFIFSQQIQAWSSRAESQARFEQSVFEAKYAPRIGNIALLGTAVGIVYFIVSLVQRFMTS